MSPLQKVNVLSIYNAKTQRRKDFNRFRGKISKKTLRLCVFAFNKITDCKQIRKVYCFECTFCSGVIIGKVSISETIGF